MKLMYYFQRIEKCF